MKRLIINSALVGALWITGCVDNERTTFVPGRVHGPRHFYIDASGSGSGSSSGGIDPITLAGIEASNRAAQDQADATVRMANDMATQAAVDGANAAAAQAAANAAQAAANAANAGQ